MADYNLNFTGAQVNKALDNVHNADTTPTTSSDKMVTSGGIKTYVDSKTLSPTRGYNSFSHPTADMTVIQNTTGHPLFVQFTGRALAGTGTANDVEHLILDISQNNSWTGLGTNFQRISQCRIGSDATTNNFGANVSGGVPAGWYWRIQQHIEQPRELIHSSFMLQ